MERERNQRLKQVVEQFRQPSWNKAKESSIILPLRIKLIKELSLTSDHYLFQSAQDLWLGFFYVVKGGLVSLFCRLKWVASDLPIFDNYNLVGVLLRKYSADELVFWAVNTDHLGNVFVKLSDSLACFRHALTFLQFLSKFKGQRRGLSSAILAILI